MEREGGSSPHTLPRNNSHVFEVMSSHAELPYDVHQGVAQLVGQDETQMVCRESLSVNEGACSQTGV